MLLGADLLNQNSRGVKRERSPDTYQVSPTGPAGDDGMLWSILCTCTWSPSTCLMLHVQGGATTTRGTLADDAVAREQIEIPGNAENQ